MEEPINSDLSPPSQIKPLLIQLKSKLSTTAQSTLSLVTANSSKKHHGFTPPSSVNYLASAWLISHAKLQTWHVSTD
jgi:hypothetical protein